MNLHLSLSLAHIHFYQLFNNLHALHYKGELGKSEELAGRAKDGRVVDPSAKVDGVKLEYRDEFGRKLTQKEAFRQICYRFHGYGPGKKAKEKRLKVPFDMML